MALEGSNVRSEGRYVHANGIDIYYVEAGEGEPLLLINNAMVSSNPIWAPLPFAYASSMGTFAELFRVIAPDTRGSGRTLNPGGDSIPYTLLADDIVALIEALDLDRPSICGFSDGAEIATLVGIRTPESVRAVVNHAGYELFNPDPHSPTIALQRQMLGGSPDATEANFEAMADLAEQSQELAAMFELMELDHDGAQGAGHWKTVVGRTYERISEPHGYTFEDMGKVTVPTLILTGDRDPFCTVEEGVEAYRALQQGELAVLPNTGHLISPSAVAASIDFLERHQLTR